MKAFKKILTVGLLFITLSCFAQRGRNDVGAFHLIGRVKSIMSNTHCTDTSRRSFCSEGKRTIRFDTSGYRIHFGSDSFTRSFNSKGQLEKYVDYTGKKRKDSITICYKYSDEGVLTQQVILSTIVRGGFKKEIINFNARGLPISGHQEYADTSRNYQYEKTYKYDSRDSVIEERNTNPKNNRTYITRKSYDELGFITSDSLIDYKGTLTWAHVYKNDARGNHIYETWEGTGASGYFKTYSNKKYDDHNNCIEDECRFEPSGRKDKIVQV